MSDEQHVLNSLDTDPVLILEEIYAEPEGIQIAIEEPIEAEEPVEEELDEEPVEEELEEEPVEEEPAVIVEEPVVIVEEPVVIVEEPVVIVEEPVVIVEEPVVIVEEPVVIVEEPVVIVEEPVEEPSKEEVPKCVFIIPYRDREEHRLIFMENMKTYLEANPQGQHKFLYIHQTDRRGFNRGAMKNIGFIVVKQMYPNDYQNITLVFNDVDSMPVKEAVIKYETCPGTIKHFYGFDYTLGGIVSVNAGDFEKVNGFPNFWSWGYEDNLLQIRANDAKLKIDRDTFFPINHPNIIRLSEPQTRIVNKSEFSRFERKTTEGIYSIRGLNYIVNNETGFVDVLSFDTHVAEQLIHRTEYDLRNGPAPFKNVIMGRSRGATMGMHFF